MNNRIAILLNKEQQLASLTEVATIHIYEKSKVWEVVKVIESEDITDKQENDTKNFMLSLIAELEGCKVIVGTLILGIPYYLFIRAGYEVCEASEFSMLLLEQLYDDYCKPLTRENQEENQTENVSTNPIPIDVEGNFFIDIISVQKTYPQLSTKKILLPFLSDSLFSSLKIKCSHIMPWLESYVEQRRFHIQIDRYEGQYIILITHQLCS